MIQWCACRLLPSFVLFAGVALAQVSGTPPEPTAVQNPSQGSTAVTQPKTSAPNSSTQQPESKPQAGKIPEAEPGPAAITGPPQTRILDASALGKHTGVTGSPDPLLDTPPAPKGDATLIGGLAMKVDRIRNRITVEPFGSGRRVSVFVDERTHIFRNGTETTILGIRKGDRVYADTVLDGPHVFAKNLRVLSESTPAEVRGQITAYEGDRITLQDALSDHPVSFRITSQTRIEGAAGNTALAPGALIDVMFGPEKAGRGVAQQVTVLARPGALYTFAGTLTNVNMRDGVLSIDNQSDSRTYDVQFDPRGMNTDLLRVGANVNISATFNGDSYRVRNLTPMSVNAGVPQNDQR